MVFTKFDGSSFIFEPTANFVGTYVLTIQLTDNNASPKSRTYKLKVHVSLLITEPTLTDEEKALLSANLRGNLRAKVYRVNQLGEVTVQFNEAMLIP